MAKIYISGQITGNLIYKQLFAQAESALKAQGHTVINPAVETEGLTQRDYMRISLARLESADFIYMLPGWEYSKGAQIERMYAEYIGIVVAKGDLTENEQNA